MVSRLVDPVDLSRVSEKPSSARVPLILHPADLQIVRSEARLVREQAIHRTRYRSELSSATLDHASS